MTQHATATAYNRFWTLKLNLNDSVLVAQLNHILTMASAVIDVNIGTAAVAAFGATAWGADYLSFLTTVMAGISYTLEYGPQLTPEMKQMWLNWLDKQYSLIRTGEVDPAGDTGSGYPAFGSIQHNLTPWSEAQIIMNRAARGGL